MVDGTFRGEQKREKESITGILRKVVHWSVAYESSFAVTVGSYVDDPLPSFSFPNVKTTHTRHTKE